jgi:predicted  nucleic acid-binding Zn-ribbon protein
MKNLTDNLMALQELQGKSSRAVPNRAGTIEALRAQIPESFLNTFDRLITRNKKAVSIVHHGVCSECHLQIAVGTLGSLAFGQEVQQCGNCGRFLYLPLNESLYLAECSIKTKAVKSKKAIAAHVA